MKNLTKSLIAASFLLAGSALAVDDKEVPEAKLKVVGHVPLICTVEVEKGLLDLGHNPKAGVPNPFAGKIDFQCNSKKGAIIGLKSANGGLAHGQSKEHTIAYEAWVKVKGLGVKPNAPAAGMIAKGGQQKLYPLMTGFKDRNLAMDNMVTGELTLTLLEQIKFAGYYGDILTVTIKAKV